MDADPSRNINIEKGNGSTEEHTGVFRCAVRTPYSPSLTLNINTHTLFASPVPETSKGSQKEPDADKQKTGHSSKCAFYQTLLATVFFGKSSIFFYLCFVISRLLLLF